MLFKIEFGLLLCVWFSSISLVGFRWLPVSHATAATTTHHVLKSLLSHNFHLPLICIPFDLGRIQGGSKLGSDNIVFCFLTFATRNTITIIICLNSQRGFVSVCGERARDGALCQIVHSRFLLGPYFLFFD